MFDVSVWLDSIKEKAGIESDYRLSKMISKNPSTISSYRQKRSLPDEEIIALLCEVSGDDFMVILAEVQQLRAKTDTARALWQRVAARLQGAGQNVAHAAFVMLFVVCLMGFYPGDASASTLSLGASLCILCKVGFTLGRVSDRLQITTLVSIWLIFCLLITSIGRQCFAPLYISRR